MARNHAFSPSFHILFQLTSLRISTSISKVKSTYFPKSRFMSLLKAYLSHVNLKICATNPACCAEIYPAKSFPLHRKCFNNIQSLCIRQQMFLNSTGNYFQNRLNIAILLIIACNIRPFCLHFL